MDKLQNTPKEIRRYVQCIFNQQKLQALIHLFVKSKKKESPSFHKDGILHSMNTERAEILNDQFKSVYS